MAELTTDDLRIVLRIAVFNGLKSHMVHALIAPATIVTLKHGHPLFRQGESAEAFFIVIEGWIKLYRITPAGDEAVIHVLTKGESFAEAVAFTGNQYPATAEAASDARVVRIPADHVISCIREIPDIALAMIASTSQHLHRLVQQIEQLTAQSALQRVAEFLGSLCPCASGPYTMELPYDKSLIAGRLGLKPESLSRVFARLRKFGVEVRGSHVLVNEIANLRGLVESDRIRAHSKFHDRP